MRLSFFKCCTKEPMTFADLATRVAQQEGKKRSVNIAQISEITKIVLEEIAALKPRERRAFLKKYR